LKINKLNGFSPKVKVEISKNTQISTILAQTAEKISKVETEGLIKSRKKLLRTSENTNSLKKRLRIG